MSVDDLFTRDLWETIGKDLGGVAGRWWDENRDDLVALSKEEATEILRALRDGDTLGAKLEIAARMSPQEFRAYRKGTTDQLMGIARRRAAMLEALGDLGKRAAMLIGAAAAGALGF